MVSLQNGPNLSCNICSLVIWSDGGFDRSIIELDRSFVDHDRLAVDLDKPVYRPPLDRQAVNLDKTVIDLL